MDLKVSYSKAQIEAAVRVQMERLDKAVIRNLRYVGEEFVRNARENGTYKDQTGNLRNSIGFVVLKDGEQLVENFRASAKISDDTRKKNKLTGPTGRDGLVAAKTRIRSLSQLFPTGYVLIVVAGMKYAAYVESNGLDVLTASSIQAKKSLKANLQRIELDNDQLSL